MFNDPGELKDAQSATQSHHARTAEQLCADLEPITAARCRAWLKPHLMASSVAILSALLRTGRCCKNIYRRYRHPGFNPARRPNTICAIRDVGDIVEIIRPLEAAGLLVPRSRALLEQEINHHCRRVGWCHRWLLRFTRSQMLLNWLALQSMSPIAINTAIWALAARRLKPLRTVASEGVNSLFVLTTQTQEWFVKRGFTPTDVELPSDKQTLYNWQRGSACYENP